MTQLKPVLLPCPFCGGTNGDVVEASTFRWRAWHCECGITGPEARIQTAGEGTHEEWEAVARKEAIEAWNTRAALRGEPVAEVISFHNSKVRWLGKHAFGLERVDALHPGYLQMGTKLYTTPQPSPAEAWRPIESAPKDGTEILLVNPKGNIASGLWQGDGTSEGWWLRGGGGPNFFFNHHHSPTHWMPLPAPPLERAGGV